MTPCSLQGSMPCRSSSLMSYCSKTSDYARFMIKLEIELKGLKEAMESLSAKHVERAARMAINKSATAGRTEASKAIREKFNLPVARVNAEVKNIRIVRIGSLPAIIRAEAWPISLTAFGAKYVCNDYGGSF